MIYSILTIATLIIGLAYITLIWVYLKNWNSLAETTLPEDFVGQVDISVIIPIRNEARHIRALLESIIANTHPKHLLEIIIIDDHSTDESQTEIQSIKDERIKIIALADTELPEGLISFKKFGIEKAVKEAKGELIITTDGDCVVPKNWLRFFAYAYEVQNKKFVAAPVNFNFANLYLYAFQCLDFMGMMLVTGANVQRKKGMMCNGANMGYSKELFLSVGGYQGLKKQASGDDVMLLNKVAKKDTSLIGFIKNRHATVQTAASTSWRELVQQRLRWATKNSNSEDLGLKMELGIVFVTNWFLIILIPMVFIYGSKVFILLVGLFLSLFIGNYLLLRKASIFFDKRWMLRYFRISFYIHMAYILFIGTASLFKKTYQWKGRKVR